MVDQFDYSLQNTKIKALLAQLKTEKPLDPRFTMRAMTPSDIPACAHLCAHAFRSTNALLARSLNLNYELFVYEWMAELQDAIHDHLTFVIVDTQYNSATNKDYATCKCNLHYTSHNIFEPANIVAIVVCQDLCTPCAVIDPVVYRQLAIGYLMKELEIKRQEKIRQDDSLAPCKERIKAEKLTMLEKAKQNRENFRNKVRTTTGAPHVQNGSKKLKDRDPALDNARTKPFYGEGIEIRLLATRTSYMQHGLGYFCSNFALNYIKKYTSYKYATLQAVHPATERIWVHKLGGKVMSRIKTPEFEFIDENEKKSCVFKNVDYNVCSIDLDLVPHKETITCIVGGN